MEQRRGITRVKRKHKKNEEASSIGNKMAEEIARRTKATRMEILTE